MQDMVIIRLGRQTCLRDLGKRNPVRKTCRPKQSTYAHQQIPQMQNEELSVDHHKFGNH